MRMLSKAKTLAAAVAVLAVVGLVILVGLIRGPAGPSVCNGVSDALGGCAEAQPTFTGATCQAVGAELGKQLDERHLAIIRGEDIVDGEAKSARLSATEFLLVTRANQHLRESGLITDCDVDDVLAAAEPQLSVEVRDGVGNVMVESQTHTYQDWLARLRQTLSVIDMEEGPDSGDSEPRASATGKDSLRLNLSYLTLTG